MEDIIYLNNESWPKYTQTAIAVAAYLRVDDEFPAYVETRIVNCEKLLQ